MSLHFDESTEIEKSRKENRGDGEQTELRSGIFLQELTNQTDMRVSESNWDYFNVPSALHPDEHLCEEKLLFWRFLLKVCPFSLSFLCPGFQTLNFLNFWIVGQSAGDDEGSKLQENGVTVGFLPVDSA